MYDIFVDIAAVWDKMADDQSQSRVAEILGGTRNRAGIMSTIQSISDAINAYSDATNSAGTATEANNLYMETTAAHVEQLKAAFQELSYDTFNGDLMKGVVDFGKGSLNVIDGLIDHIGTLGTTIAGVGISALIKGIKQYKSIASSLPEGTGALEGIFGFTNAGAVAIGAGAVTAAIAIYQQYKKVQEEQRQQALQAGDTYKSTVSSLDEYANKIVELKDKIADSNTSEGEAYEAKKELLSIQQQLTEEYGKSAQALDLLNDSEQQSLQNLLDMKRQAANDLLNTDVEGYKDAEKELAKTRVDDLGSFLNNGNKEGKAIEELTEKYSDFISVTDETYWGAKTGLSRLTFGGTAEQEVETLEAFMEDLRSLRKEIDQEGGDTSAIDSILGYSSNAFNDANEVLNKYHDIIDAHKEAEFTADDTQYFDKSAIEWLDEYTSAIEDYNKALESGDPEEIQKAASAFESVDDVVQALLGNTSMGKYLDFFKDVREQLKESLVDINDLENAITNVPDSPQGDFFQRSLDRVKSLNMTADDLRNNIFDIENGVMSGNPHQRSTTLQATQDLITAMSMLEGVNIYDDDGNIKVDAVVSALNQLGALAEQASQIEDAVPTLESFSDYQSTLTSALNASASATGLTTEQITGLTEAYQDIEGFDPNRLFETTTNGIHLNAKELNNLNKILENTKMKKFAEDIKDAQDELDELTAKYGENSDQAKAAQKRLDDLRREEAQYEGLTSAYNKWQQAQSQTDERASYESVGKGFETVGNLVEHGWINDAEVGTFLDLVLGKVDAIGNVAKRSGDNLRDFESLSNNIVGGISGTDYGVSVKDLWTYGEDGGLTPGGIQQMLKLANQFDSSIVSMQETADGTSVKINLMGDNMNRLSQELGLSAEMIQLFERAALDAGADMILDSTNLGLMTDQVKTLTQNNEALAQTLSGFDWSNVENWDSDEVQRAIEALDEGIKQVGDDTEEARNQADLMRTTIESLQMQQVRTEVNAQISSGKSYDDLLSMSDEEIQATFHVEADGVDEVRSQIEELKAEAESTSITVSLEEGQFNELTGGGEETEKTATVRFEKDTSEIDGYEPGEKSATVRYGKDTSLPDGWQPQDKTATATYTLNAPAPPSYPNMSRTVTYTIRTIGSKPSLATGTMISMAHADGSMVNAPWNWISGAYANGRVDLPQDEYALVNELPGTESIIRDGHWMMLPGGMHMEALKKGDIILSAAQTKALINSGRAAGHGHAYAYGSLISNAYDMGSWNWNKDWTSPASSSSNSGGGSKGSGGSGGSGNNSNDNNSDDELEIFDWIELAIDRIERAIKQLGITAKSTFKTLTTRLEANATEIKTVTDEIELQQKAYDRYIQQANSVGLSEDLAQRVRDGAIDINEYDKDTQELIDDYQKWYLINALLCSNA